MEDIGNRDAFVFRLKDLYDQVLGALAHGLHLRNCIEDGVLLISNFSFRTCSMISLSLSPSKGGTAVSRMYRMTPADQISQ